MASLLRFRAKALTTTTTRFRAFSKMPHLMLPPLVEENQLSYQFHVLGEEQVVKLKGGRGGTVVGSSHGWLALFDKSNCHLTLSNPYSGRQMDLPEIRTLPIPGSNLEGGYGCVRNLILSCSPETEGCRALMSFGPEKRLAFCCPGHSREWTAIGDRYVKEGKVRIAKSCVASVHWDSKGMFFCASTPPTGELEAWDLRDPERPSSLVIPVGYEDPSKSPVMFRWKNVYDQYCSAHRYLVVGAGNTLYSVVRFVGDWRAEDGSFFSSSSAWNDTTKAYDMLKLSYKTVDFAVYKLDEEARVFKYMKQGLDGFSFFIGLNHSVALSAEASSVLKPNCIYFTDALEPIQVHGLGDRAYGGHDVGIFDYAEKTIFPCHVGAEPERIQPPPVWFFPAQP